MIADTTQPVYVKAVRDFLNARGVADPKVQITRVLRVDLEGNGEEEVLISATNYFTNDKSNVHNFPLQRPELVIAEMFLQCTEQFHGFLLKEFA
jgi:hypothetical protein